VGDQSQCREPSRRANAAHLLARKCSIEAAVGQLLGWLVVPAAFKAFGWWLAPKAPLVRQLGG